MSMSQGQPPFFRTPLTDFSAMFGLIDIQLSRNPLCKKFELKYFNCLEAYGIEKGVEKCSAIYDDLLECKFSEKQRARMEKMRMELEAQMKEGKRTYSKSPDLDAVYEIHF